MNAYENQFVAYLPDETVRMDRELYLIGASLKVLGRKCFGFTKMSAGASRRITWLRSGCF